MSGCVDVALTDFQAAFFSHTTTERGFVGIPDDKTQQRRCLGRPRMRQEVDFAATVFRSGQRGSLTPRQLGVSMGRYGRLL